jgi:L-cysteine desulfidase
MDLTFSEYLAEEWRPALGCTEPAAIAYATASAAAQGPGEVRQVKLVCDPRIFKNCYAVGIPHSGHKIGIRWAAAIGAHLRDASAKLECFRGIDDSVLEAAGALLERGGVQVEVDAERDGLFVDCTVRRGSTEGRAVIEECHTRLVRLERDGVPLPLDSTDASVGPTMRARIAGLSLAQLEPLCDDLTQDDRAALRQGSTLNLAIARHGLGLFSREFRGPVPTDALTRLSRLVSAGVYARMWGEDLVVMSLAGSGNKGITCAVPLTLWGEEVGCPPELVERALALACLLTTATTHHLGTLSAVCGCSNAAGIGLAAGLVVLGGGGTNEISLAVSNMVGNVTGMICDGAKIGCALKTMTAVDAAFRAAALALDGIGIPASDGIVGSDGRASLANMGRIAQRGMSATDREILAIMQEKMR